MIYIQIEYGFETATAADSLGTKIKGDHGLKEETEPSVPITISYSRVYNHKLFTSI